MWGFSLQELFLRGGGVMWPLLIFSILAIAVAAERIAVFLWKGHAYHSFVSSLREKLVSAGGVDAALDWLRGIRSPLAVVSSAYLARVEQPAELRRDIVSREASVELARMEKRLHWLAVIGHLSPMIGLLGTVVGLVEAFHQIELVGGQVQPSDLASGIWKALLTTVFGLIVALPTLAVYHFLDQRVGAIATQMQWLVTHLDEWLHQQPAKEAAASDDKRERDAPVEIGISAD